MSMLSFLSLSPFLRGMLKPWIMELFQDARAINYRNVVHSLLTIIIEKEKIKKWVCLGRRVTKKRFTVVVY